MPLGRRALKGTLLLAGVLASLLASQQASASSSSLWPPKGKVFLGVSDRGSKKNLPEYGVTEFNKFTTLTGRHAALLQTFVRWGTRLEKTQPYERWRKTKTRPIIHISTKKEENKKEVELITPEQIALGGGDDYLLELNAFFAKYNLRAYVRPLGEPNRCANLWSAVKCTGVNKGHLKGGAHSSTWYKQAFRRISAIVRGGPLKTVNATLASVHLPPVKSTKGPVPANLPKPPVLIVWSTLTDGSPEMDGNHPLDYWPGSQWVGLVGADFYPDQKWADLNHLYSRPYLREKAFGITEWAVKEKDDPEFAERIVAWTLKRRDRVKMLAYYDGFEKEVFNLERYPRTAATVRRLFRNPTFLSYAQPNAGSLPPLPTGR